MSRTLGDVSVPIVQVIDPTIDTIKPRVFAVKRGPSRVNYAQYAASSVGTSNIVWNYVTTGSDVVTDRCIKMIWTVEYKFAGTPVAGSKLIRLGTSDSPRGWPINRSIISVNMTLNNAPSIWEPARYIDAMSRINCDEARRNNSLSTSPVMPDWNQAYSDYNLAGQQGGTNRNPLANWAECATEQTRGGFPYDGTPTDSVGATTATYTYTFTEPLMVPPLLMDPTAQSCGLDNLQTLNLNITIDPNFASGVTCWSHDYTNGSPVLTCTARIVGNPIFLVRQVLMPVFVDRPVGGQLLPWYDINCFNQGPFTVAAGASSASGVVSSNIMQFDNIPSRLIVWCRERDSVRTMGSCDTFANITNCKVVWGTTPLLNDASESQLYELSRANGLQLPYNAWKQYVGSVLVIDPTHDLGISDPLEAAGSVTKFSFQVVLTIRNPSLRSIDYDLYVLRIMEGTICVKSERAEVMIGPWSQKGLVSAPKSSNIPAIDHNETRQLYGGDMWSQLKPMGRYARKFGHMLGKAGKQVGHEIWDNREGIIKAVPTILNVARMLGAGEGEAPEQQPQDSRETKEQASDESESDQEQERHVRFNAPMEIRGGREYSAQDLQASFQSTSNKLRKGVEARGAGLAPPPSTKQSHTRSTRPHAIHGAGSGPGSLRKRHAKRIEARSSESDSSDGKTQALQYVGIDDDDE